MIGRTGSLWIAVAVAVWPGPVVAESRSPALVTVFAAASLADALSEIGEAYRATRPAPQHQLRFSFAATSTLARQIEAGAPAEIFASASTIWMDYLEARLLTDTDSRVSPIGNRLVLIAPADSHAEAVLLDRQILDDLLGENGRLALGDPAHVPAGMYARQALQRSGLWGAVESRLAFANDVRGVLALVERGTAPLGIVYATDAAISDRVQVRATFPAASHDPIRYSFAMVAGHSTEAAAVLAFMCNATALGIFRRHGFTTP